MLALLERQVLEPKVELLVMCKREGAEIFLWELFSNGLFAFFCVTMLVKLLQLNREGILLLELMGE